MKSIRNTLDHLMGKDRDLPLKERHQIKRHFDTSDICKYFLLDFCPHDILLNTKSNIGPCKRRHDIYLKNSFLNNANKDQYRIKYEEDLILLLEDIVDEADLKIKKAQEKLDSQLPEAEKPKELVDQLDQLNAKIEELITEAGTLGEEGLISQSEKLMNEVDKLKEKKLEINNMIEHPLIAKEKMMQICEICGALQSMQDNELRKQTHYEGRMHTAFFKIRAQLDILKKNKANRKIKAEELRENERKLQELHDKERQIDNNYEEDEKDYYNSNKIEDIKTNTYYNSHYNNNYNNNNGNGNVSSDNYKRNKFKSRDYKENSRKSFKEEDNKQNFSSSYNKDNYAQNNNYKRKDDYKDKYSKSNNNYYKDSNYKRSDYKSDSRYNNRDINISSKRDNYKDRISTNDYNYNKDRYRNRSRSKN